MAPSKAWRFLDVPAFSVQYHPEAAPGSTDSQYLFTAFTRLMDEWKRGIANEAQSGTENEDYLAIDIAKDRLAGWNFGSNDKESDQLEVLNAEVTPTGTARAEEVKKCLNAPTSIPSS